MGAAGHRDQLHYGLVSMDQRVPSTCCTLIAMIGIGMLSHTGNNVAMDSYGPISDNANGIGEMAWHGMEDEQP